MKRLLTFFAAIMTGSAVSAQIPNAGFENWTNTGGYYVPAGWGNLNIVTNPTYNYTCMQGTPGYAGSSYLRLITKTVTGMGVKPGIAVSGIIDTATSLPVSGFPFALRPANLEGAWQYMGFSGDVGYISVLLSKWNAGAGSRDTVAFYSQMLSGMVMSWATFSLPLSYRSTAIPDSALIVLSASGSVPANNSYLYIDTLTFTGNVPNKVSTIADEQHEVIVYPNPATNTVNISYYNRSAASVTVSVYDINGRNIPAAASPFVAGKNILQLDVSGYAKGVYFVRISDGTVTEEKKLVIE